MSQDRPSTGGTLLQRILFASTWQAPTGLYAVGGTADPDDRTRTHLGPGESLTTRTYFGRVPASYLQRWTSLTGIVLTAEVAGRGNVRLCATDRYGGRRTVDEARGSWDRPTRIALHAPLDRYLDEGWFWLEADAGAEPLQLGQVEVRSSTVAPERPLAVVICTFNRPDDCVATLRALAADPLVADRIGAVHVVDQGTDRVTDADGAAEVRQAWGSRLHLVHQANLGGAGGFTRGMLDALEQAGEPVDVLLMDDDVVVEPDTVVRLAALAQHRLVPTVVGGQMLNRWRPSRLLTHAERVDLTVPDAGIPAEGIADVELLDDLPAARLDADYNAWWCCLVPSEVLDEVGLPLPIFYQWDDIELGTRARRRGIPTVTLPGAAVWHDDFVYKDGDNAVAYFWRRNSLIVAALHGDVSSTLVAGLTTELRHLAAEHRYGKVATFLAGVEAFLAGPGVLEQAPVDTLAEVVAMRAGHPDTRHLSMAELAERGLLSVVVDRDHGLPSRPDLVLRKRLLKQRLGRVGGVVAAASDAPWWHISRFRTVVVTDRSQRDVRVLELDVARRREALRAIRGTMRRLRREGGRASEAWRAAVPELIDADAWRRRFDPPGER